MGIEVTTNNIPRSVIDGAELSSVEREQFDYLNWEGIDAGRDSASFFRYKGTLYNLSDFMRSETEPWAGIYSDSAFSAIVVRYVDDGDAVVVGRLVVKG